MDCLNCGCETKVVDSIPYADTVYRRRKCLTCGFVYWTEELEVIDKKIIADARRHKKLKEKKGGTDET